MLRIVRANGWDRNLSPERQLAWRQRHQIPSDVDAKYAFYDLGFNLRPTEITGFLGLQQLAFLEANSLRREKIFRDLDAVLQSNPDLIPLKHDHISRLASFAFVVLCQSPEVKRHQIERFTAAGVEVRPVIGGNMQRQPFYKKHVETLYDLPGADFVHDCGFYFANYPELTEDDLTTLRCCLRGR